jgi:pimeloyl-ACP methyl ester carboxylesterase
MKSSSQLALALRVAPMIARVPGGKTLMRRRLTDGLRQNSGTDEWLDAETVRRYIEPLVDSVGRATSIGRRMLSSTEPEPIDSIVARVRMPVRILVGELPHPAGPSPSEVAMLAQARVIRLPGIGFFAHEEAPHTVVQIVDAPVIVANANVRRVP